MATDRYQSTRRLPQRRPSLAFGAFVSVFLGLIIARQPRAAEESPCGPAGEATVESVQGGVEIRRAGQTLWRQTAVGAALCSGDSLRVQGRSRATLYLREAHTIVPLDQYSAITIPESTRQVGTADLREAVFILLQGAANFLSRTPISLKIKTPFVNAHIEGTEFLVQVGANSTTVTVFEGSVLAENAHGSLTLGSGEAATAERNRPPVRKIEVRPTQNAVAWALYYPPLIDYRSAVDPKSPNAAILRQSIEHYRQGRIEEALALLDRVPDNRRDASLLGIRASLLLSVGRVDEANVDLLRLRRLDPGNGTALALESVVAVAQNRKEAALDLAGRAVAAAPESPTPWIALSYANQANFAIGKALENIEAALRLAPDNALVWARRAELELSLNEQSRAQTSAEKAVALDPRLARTQTILGFAALARTSIWNAKGAFTRAIQLDSSDPLARFGLALAKIRDGDLDGGTRDIEIAVMLDPNNSLMRSYLGKAYYEQKRSEPSGTEYDVAKQLDPRDPTPYFYEAIKKQTENRPVEALHDLQTAIELNDNRAVYRSKQLLDSDLAARSASQGRIYNDLGFGQRALLEGWKSVNNDPGNYSGHRFLADTYSKLRRHEIARVSELLQSQLLQPLNVTPVQPQLTESNPLILDGAGPARISFNEFNPLFLRNRLALQASGVFGGNNTIGDEVVQSGVWDQFSYSLGQFHYETDGFRKNNDTTQDIYTAFAQTQLTSNINLLTEFRHNESESGFLPFRFDPDDFLPNQRINLRKTSARLGLNVAPSAYDNILISATWSDVDVKTKDSNATIFQPPLNGSLTRNIFTEIDSTNYNLELQTRHQTKRANVIFGAGHIDENRKDHDFISNTIYLPDFFPKPLIEANPCNRDSSAKLTNLYLYPTLTPLDNLNITTAVSYDAYDDSAVGVNRVNPKLGLVWEATDNTTVRAAYIKSTKRPLVSNQTIEPTQIAGFNQFFDDFNGSTIERYGIGLDQVFSPNLLAGMEVSWRDLKVPLSSSDESTCIVTARKEDRDEQQHRAYFYWTPTDNLALSVEYGFEKIQNNKQPRSFDFLELETHRLPVAINYFHASGFFAGLSATYVEQRLTNYQPVKGGDFIPKANDSFFVVDFSLGYRLPKRFGIINFGIKNLFDEKFNYFEEAGQTENPRLPMYQPTRLVFGQFTLTL